MGPEGKRKIRLRRKTNTELFSLYESELKLRHRSLDAREEANRVLGHFKKFLGEFPPSPELATSYLATFSDHKPTTLYRYHSIIKSFMEWYGEPIFSKIRLPQTLPDYIEIDEIEKLKSAMRSKKTHKKVIERNLLIIDLGLKAGLRRAEISNLKIKDIDLSRNYLIVRQGKGMQDRIIDLTPSLATKLEQFTKGKSQEEKLFNLSPSTISGIVRWAAKKAGVNIHTHSLRHFFGQNLIDTGTDIVTTQVLMGHKSLQTTQVYLGRSNIQRKQAIARLEAPVNPEPSKGAGLTVEPSDGLVKINNSITNLADEGLITKPSDLRQVYNELLTITASLGGVELNAAYIVQKCWRRFEQGISRNELVEALTKMYPSANPGDEYFTGADALLSELSLRQIIRSEQRRMAGARSQWDTTYWVLTDEGRKVVRYLERINNRSA